MAAKKGSKVKVEYEGKFENGEVFDSSTHGDHSHPLEFVVGERQVIKGFDDAVIGMEINQEKDIEINPEDAYGESKEELKKEVPKDAFPKDKEVVKGMVLALNSPDGRQFPVKIDEVKDESVVLDLNHPLAGKKLLFHLKVVGIDEPESAMVA